MELLTRDAFRESVFARDRHQCVICQTPAADAHHIIERRLWPDGGYYIANGASLCSPCHIRAEETTIGCEEIRRAASITQVVLPPHLYDDMEYDKWGNPILSNGTRLRGDLFYDESVQKILEQGGVLGLFLPYVKHPRTYHLPWSNPGSDDKILSSLDGFRDEDVVATVKLDGEQTSLYRDHIHARSLEPLSGVDASFVKALHSRICGDIPDGWRICGENVYAHHTIYYHSQNASPPYFKVFGIWDEKNVCLSYEDTLEWCALLDLEPVPLLYQGPWNEQSIQSLFTPSFNGDEMEGYVVRVARAFAYGETRRVVGKYVRPHFVPAHARHWQQGARVFNGKPLESVMG